MFSGTYTALVTPFVEGGAVDFDALRRLVDRQADAGIDGIVAMGTTGESPCLNVDEHCKVIDAVIAATDGRMQVIAGSGANSTREALSLTEHAKAAGADGTLQVTPYYNKPNQQGLIGHFSEIADLGLPVMLYNVPGRTGREIAVETVVKLSAHEHIVAVKEAAGSVDRVSAIRSRCDIAVLSGDDPLTLPMLSVGAQGVVSVASNIIPDICVAMVRHALNGEWAQARDIHMKYYRLFCDMFLDTNPIPVKTAMSMMGLIEERYRSPLCPLSDEIKTTLRATLEAVNLV